jgi:hypothetical protein
VLAALPHQRQVETAARHRPWLVQVYQLNLLVAAEVLQCGWLATLYQVILIEMV